MQVTSLTSREEHADDHDHHSHDHEHIPVRLWQMVIGVICIANSFLVEWMFDKGSTVAGLSAMAFAYQSIACWKNPEAMPGCAPPLSCAFIQRSLMTPE